MTSEDDALTRLLDDGGTAAPAPTLVYGLGPDQVFEECGPRDARTLVLVHGGYFRPETDRTHARPMAAALAAEGWRVVLAEYRRVPGAPFATTEDLAALDAHLHGHDHEVAAWVGHSAGGTLALWRALTPDLPPVRAVALAPVADLAAAEAEGLGDGAVREWIGAGPQERPRAWEVLDPVRLLAADRAAAQRIHLVHGDADETVPVSQSRCLGTDLTVVEGAHHFDLVDPASPHWPQVLTVLRESARGAGPSS